MDAPADDAPTPPGAAGPRPPPPRKSATLYFLAVLLLLPLGAAAQAFSRPAGLLWSELFVFLVPALVATAGSNLLARRYLGLGPTTPALLGLGALAGAAATLVAVVLQATVVELVPPSWLERFDVAALFGGPPWERWVLAATATFAAPVCEELAFRGYLLRTLRLRHGAAAAIGASALLFALVHLDPVRFAGLVLLGVLFGWLALRGGSVWPAIAAHAGNNAVVSWALVSAGPRAGPGAAAGAAAPPTAQVLAATALGLAVLVPVLVAFGKAAAELPPPADPLQPRDPADPVLTFRLARVPPALWLAAAAGAALLAAIALLGGPRA